MCHFGCGPFVNFRNSLRLRAGCVTKHWPLNLRAESIPKMEGMRLEGIVFNHGYIIIDGSKVAQAIPGYNAVVAKDRVCY